MRPALLLSESLCHNCAPATQDYKVLSSSDHTESKQDVLDQGFGE